MSNALVILGLLIGIAGHILKKVITRRETDATFSLKQYLTENPYKTAMTVFYAGAALTGLYYSDTQSIYTAILAGFSANSLSGASDSK